MASNAIVHMAYTALLMTLFLYILSLCIFCIFVFFLNNVLCAFMCVTPVCSLSCVFMDLDVRIKVMTTTTMMMMNFVAVS